MKDVQFHHLNNLMYGLRLHQHANKTSPDKSTFGGSHSADVQPFMNLLFQLSLPHSATFSSNIAIYTFRTLALYRNQSNPILTLNQSKSTEIVFTDSRKRRLVQPPPPLQGIARVTSLKVLGVTVIEKLSVAEHVDDVIKACARSMYMPSASCVHTACAHLYCSRSFSQSPSQSSATLLQRGGVFRRLLIACASRHSFVELLDLVCGSL